MQLLENMPVGTRSSTSSTPKCSKLNCNVNSLNLLTCESCKLLFHDKCADFDPQLYNLLINNQSKGLSWYFHCDLCYKPDKNYSEAPETELNTISSQMNDMKAGMETIKNDFKNELNSLREIIHCKLTIIEQQSKELPNAVESTIHKLSEEQNVQYSTKFTTYADKISQSNSQTQNQIKEINQKFQGLSSNIQSQVESEAERKNIESRQLNVCIFNIPEPKSTNQDEAYKEDINVIKEILKDKINLQGKDCTGIKRRGFKENNKVRPIIIKLKVKEKRAELLKLRNLKYTNNENSTNIYIAPDRTPKQITTRKRLLAEIKERKAKGESDLIIRGDKIIKYNPFQHVPEDFF